MIGKPKYAVNDVVKFIVDGKEKIGQVGVVDKYGTFFNDSDVHYDIMVKHENMFYKHIIESSIVEKITHNDNDEWWVIKND